MSENILEMPAGPEMDAKIAEFMGWDVDWQINPDYIQVKNEPWVQLVSLSMVFDSVGPIDGTKRERLVPCPEFSREIGVAFVALNFAVEIYGLGGVGRVKAPIKGKTPIWTCGIGVSGLDTSKGVSAWAETVPLAICRAVLLSVMEADKCITCYHKHPRDKVVKEGWCDMFKSPILQCQQHKKHPPDEVDIVREDDVELDKVRDANGG